MIILGFCFLLLSRNIRSELKVYDLINVELFKGEENKIIKNFLILRKVLQDDKNDPFQ